MNGVKLLYSSDSPKAGVFLLTKPPKTNRAKICLQLIARLENAVLYLAGDGVYNLLDEAIKALPRQQIFACKEDMEARGIRTERIMIESIDFYKMLVDDIMSDGTQVYAF